MTLGDLLARDLIEIADLSGLVALPPRRLRYALVQQRIAHKMGGRWWVKRDDFRDAMPLLWAALIERAAEERATGQTTKTTRTTKSATTTKKTRTCGV